MSSGSAASAPEGGARERGARGRWLRFGPAGKSAGPGAGSPGPRGPMLFPRAFVRSLRGAGMMLQFRLAQPGLFRASLWGDGRPACDGSLLLPVLSSTRPCRCSPAE